VPGGGQAQPAAGGPQRPEEPPEGPLVAGVLGGEVLHEGAAAGAVAVHTPASRVELVVDLGAVVLPLALQPEGATAARAEVHEGAQLGRGADVVYPSVELEALVLEGVRAATGNVVLLENNHAAAELGQEGRRVEPREAAADDHVVDVLRQLLGREADAEQVGIGRESWRLGVELLLLGAPSQAAEPAARRQRHTRGGHAGRNLRPGRAIVED